MSQNVYSEVLWNTVFGVLSELEIEELGTDFS